MGSKSQRKKEQYAQRRNEKRKRQQQARKRLEARGRLDQGRKPSLGLDPHTNFVQGSNERHRQRLAQQHPRTWLGESPEDAAIFDASALAALSPELAVQANAVRGALDDALSSRGEDAIKRVSVIPRGSPFSDWRLFLRGLIDWLAGESTTAGETWRRLDPERRPGRIATTMMTALRTDLERAVPFQSAPSDASPSLEGPSNAPVPAAGVWERFDADQLYHAKLLRRVRFDRAAMRVAEAGLNVPEESHKLKLGPRKTQWLKQFIAEYQSTEPELAAALAQTALHRAFCQGYFNLFEDAARAFQGPRHDPRNLLLNYFYFRSISDDSSAEQKTSKFFDEYLQRDLPQNKSLPEPLRGAIASYLYLDEAKSLMSLERAGGSLAFLFGKPDYSEQIREYLTAAAKKAPHNAAVYKSHVNWLESNLDDDRLSKPARERLEAELADVMDRWSQGVPNDTIPRLWLVDHLLENEQLEEARPHIDFLAASRQDDPRVRATPWKWQMMDAMRLCRRKVWLPQAPARLDEAEAIWPAWLSKSWFPYFQAAWKLRAGRVEDYENDRQRICQESGRTRDSLADVCMMMGAFQLMRATAAELKPFRAAVELRLKAIRTTPLEDLLETASFFWDMRRAELRYPAYRLQGKTVGLQLFDQISKNDQLVESRIDQEHMKGALLWASDCRFWSNNYQSRFPPCFSNPALKRHPIVVAASLNAVLQERYSWSKGFAEAPGQLREAAAVERDAYYRHWFADLADRAEEKWSEASRRFSSFPFGNPFEFDADDDDMDDGDMDDGDMDDGDDQSFDPDCDCPACRAAREAAAGAKTQQFFAAMNAQARPSN